MTPDEIAFGVVLGIVIVLFLIGVREHTAQGDGPYDTPATLTAAPAPTGVAPAHCPCGQGTHAVVIHTGGSSFCLDCGTTTPGGTP